MVDLGTNSTRLLVAEVGPGGGLEELERVTTVTRLGEGVDATGRLAPQAIDRVLQALAEYRQAADRHGAQRSVAVATSAVRDASNGQELRDLARERHGFEIETISGEEEARLTFLGATAGREGEETLVIDVGGGSTEYVVGRPGSPPRFHVSTQMGSVRQTERHLAGDPPSHEDLAALAEEARSIAAAEVPRDIRQSVRRAIAVAGTPTSLAAIDQALVPYDPARVHGYLLNLGECERMLAMLAALPVAERREVPGLHPDRAPTILAGAAILIESLRVFGLDQVEASENDILHGAAIDALSEGGDGRGEGG